MPDTLKTELEKMKRDLLNISGLHPQALLNGVDFCDGKVSIGSSSERTGSGLFVTEDIDQEDAVLVRVPSDLVLSLENVWIYAKSDKHLREVLEATDEFSRTAKNAIRLFLLLQLTHGASDGAIGVTNFFSVYVKYLPEQFDLPTFWDENELRLLQGTSLVVATETKLKSLNREFTLLREKTANIEWCQKYWWNANSGIVSFHDWKVVDAMYRSRAMDLPGTGFATVPVMDMANHAAGIHASARYETDSEGNGVLLLRDSVKLKKNNEITISYGDDNGAAEMLHSYGFIESTMSSANQIWLDLDIPSDDPLRLAKKHAANSAPGFRLFQSSEQTAFDAQSTDQGSGQIQWEGAYAWLVNINEEDGLEFNLLRTNDGETELQMSWKGTILSDLSNLEALLLKESQYDIFKLRVVTMLQERLSDQLSQLEQSKESLSDVIETAGGKSKNYHNAMRLRDLEERMMLQAYEEFGSQQAALVQSSAVQDYLRSMREDVQNETVPDDDFA